MIKSIIVGLALLAPSVVEAKVSLHIRGDARMRIWSSSYPASMPCDLPGDLIADAQSGDEAVFKSLCLPVLSDNLSDNLTTSPADNAVVMTTLVTDSGIDAALKGWAANFLKSDPCWGSLDQDPSQWSRKQGHGLFLSSLRMMAPGTLRVIGGAVAS